MGHQGARQHGVAVNGLRNAHHIGRVGTYGETAARAGMVACTSSTSLQGPPGGSALPADGRGDS